MAVHATRQDPATYFQRLFTRTNSEAEVYKHLVDVYPLRVEDDFKNDAYPHGTYTEDPAGPLPHFQDFLTRVEQEGLLQDWWDSSKRRVCEETAMGGTYSNIWVIIEKPHVQETYGNPMMPMVFRTIADRVYGKVVMA